MTSLLNEIVHVQERLVLVLDDYHVIQSATNQAIAQAQFITGQSQDAQLRLRDAQGLSHLAEPDLLGHIAVIRARIALADQDLPSAVQHACQALEYVPARHPIHGHVAVIEGQAAFLHGDLVEASRALREAVSIAQECGHPFMVVDATTRLGTLQTLQGHLHQALETYQEALQHAHMGGHMLPVAGNAHLLTAFRLESKCQAPLTSKAQEISCLRNGLPLAIIGSVAPD